MNLFSDVARDFLLLTELDQKKIVLIGPRSSTNGLFHGPIWTYINYPAYIAGHGDPIVVAWYWIILEIIFLFSGFFMVRKLFGTLSGLCFTVLASIRLALHIDGLFHAEATYLFMPAFIFTIGMYVQTKRFFYLVLHLLVASVLVQLEIGVGLQFFILSSFIIVFLIIKQKRWRDLLAFSFVPLFLLNFILFDVRHGFRMLHALLSTGKSTHFFVSIGSWLSNRMNNGLSLQLTEDGLVTPLVLVTFLIVMVLTILQIKQNKKQRPLYVLFLFYYFGYLAMSFFNKGILLVHYTYLLVPLTAIWVSSFLTERKYQWLLILIAFVVINNLQNAIAYTDLHLRSFSGKNYNSWKALSRVASFVTDQQKHEEFGYFVFSPDAFAYQLRYAMQYEVSASHEKGFEYTKKPTTYIVAAPPPSDDPYMTYVWWRENSIRINKDPLYVEKFPGGFAVEKFQLTSEEQAIPHDKTIEVGLNFR